MILLLSFQVVIIGVTKAPHLPPPAPVLVCEQKISDWLTLLEVWPVPWALTNLWYYFFHELLHLLLFFALSIYSCLVKQFWTLNTPQIKYFSFSFYYYYFLSFWHLLGHSRGTWRFPGQGSNRSCSCQAYATATPTQDPIHVCNLHHSSQQRWILNPLSEARDWTPNLMVISRRVC